MLLLACLLSVVMGQASCLKFRMFPNLSQKECISEAVPDGQWDMVLDTVERNFRKNANRNLTNEEIATRLASFRRPVKAEFGFVTMSPTKSDQSAKPISYVLTSPKGEIIASKSGVTQEEVDFKHVGTKVSANAEIVFLVYRTDMMSHTERTMSSFFYVVFSFLLSPKPFFSSVSIRLHELTNECALFLWVKKGPYTLCLTAEKAFGVVEVDVSYFAVNVPEAIGTSFEKSADISEEDLRDMQPSITEEEMQFFAQEEHIVVRLCVCV